MNKKVGDWEEKGKGIGVVNEAMGKSYDKLMEQGENCMREKGKKGANELWRKIRNGMMK